jgi:cytidine deaminase
MSNNEQNTLLLIKFVLMKNHDISFTYTEFGSIEELSPDDRELVTAAREAAGKAYAPYSRFNVGAALRLESGRIVCGSNVENAAFPSGLCAERTALAYAVSNFPGDRAKAMAIAARDEAGFTEESISPCGNCRQVIAEEEKKNGKAVRIILAGKKGILVIESVGDLLPLQFSRDNLKTILP